MNLLQIKYFHEVVRHKTLSAAADSLYITQPALSNAVRELEKEFEIKLFNRRHGGMELTPEGEEFYKISKNILSSAHYLKDKMSELSKGRKVLKLGIPPMIGAILLPEILGKFRSENPGIELLLSEGGKDELLKELKDDNIDMVFIPHNSPVSSEFNSEKIAEFEIVCCVSPENPLSALKAITPSDLKDMPLVLFKDGFFQTGIIKQWFSKSGVGPEILLQTEQFSTLESLIKRNLCAGFVFKKLTENNPNLCSVSASVPMMSDVSLVWKKGLKASEINKNFAEFVKKAIDFDNDIC